MNRYVIDASVAIKWYVPEIHSDAALRVLDSDDELIAPDLLYAEFGNILWKKSRRGELDQDQLRAAVTAFRVTPVQMHVSNPLFDAALDIALHMNRSFYDSLYLALAVLQQCRLITADLRLHNAIRGTALESHILWLEEYGKGEQQ